jgi:hypothetical protein
VTTTNAQAAYNGPAEIDFSITDNGKVGIGRTFYQLDGGTVTVASHVIVTAPGPHQLDYWSKDQSGNTESAPNTVLFTVAADTTPPTTTSDARATYSQGAVIMLTATDASTQGVKNTYFSLNGGPTQTGTSVSIPATSGTIAYTLTFWSEDWSGNIESTNSVSFTVTSGSGTFRLVWWDCDVYPSQAPGGNDWANWTVRRGGPSGYVVASGSGASPNWSGINDVPVQFSPDSYFVRVTWWDSVYGNYEITDFPNVYVTSPGQVVRLSY